MNFKFAEEINPLLEESDFENALKIAKSNLEKIPYTEFHEILNISLLSQVDDLLKWIEEFSQSIIRREHIGALYFEMNEFDINTDLWYIDGFAYKEDGGFDLDDMDWLCDWDADSQEEINSVFEIEGLEKIQIAFSEITEKMGNDEWDDNQQDARDWCEQIILALFMELIWKTHEKARQKELYWSRLPIYFTEHSYDFILKSDAKK